MAERPILFSGEMVRAILDGRKTVTRRIIKPQPVHCANYVGEGPGLLQVWPNGRFHFAHDPYRKLPCPHGEPGDRLWVRETFREVHPCAVDTSRFSIPGRAGIPGPPGVTYRVVYRADGEVPQYWSAPEFPYRTTELTDYNAAERRTWPLGEGPGWTPSIHMPRWACRLELDIVDVRVERLQEITEEDAAAEGAEVVNGHPELGALIGRGPSHREGFAQLWRELNGSGDIGWDANPWVFRIEFQKGVSA